MDQILIAWIGGADIEQGGKQQHLTTIDTQYEYLSNPQDLRDNYETADQLLQVVIKQYKKAKMHLQITPDTPYIRTYHCRNICCNSYDHLLQEAQ